jgi:hypothetical protein
MADALASLDAMSEHVNSLEAKVTSRRSRTISALTVQPIARSLAKQYFESVRPTLESIDTCADLIRQMDSCVQAILQHATGRCLRKAYFAKVKEIRTYTLEATIALMKNVGDGRLVLSQTEREILNTLAVMLPAAAGSYEQALRDIAQGARISWRGTGAELRECLREVIDHLAPDDKVMTTQGFKLEDNQNRPTQRQKVRYILKARRSPSAAVEVAEGSLGTVDQAIATLARSTYTRGAVSTHVGGAITEIKKFKRYVDALLGELLEVT